VKVFKHLAPWKWMRKRVLAFLFIGLMIISIGTVIAGSADYSDEIDKAFICLDKRVQAASLSLDEAIFSAMAKIKNAKVNTTINSQKSSSDFCWPSSGCDVKETAQVALAKLRMGENVDNITAWLESKTGTTQTLTWYLQISMDSNGAGTCAVNYDGVDHQVNIDGDMKLSGTPGNCLSFANSNYWLKIGSNCFDKEFSIQCNESFKTNLLYEKNGGNTIFVSSETHGASANAWTTEAISARCFVKGTACDYEGSLWAATALYANSEDISEFAPYLRAMSSDNSKYFPSAFLVAILEGGEEHYANIISNEKTRPEGAYWEMSSSPYGKYYDTALAMMALGGGDAPEIENANTLGYLFEHQDESGCWNGGNIRDTAFIIYAAEWLRGPGSYSCGDGIVNGDDACDGDDLNGNTCSSQGYTSGNLSCYNNNCTLNTDSCDGYIGQVCNDSAINGNEVCDCGLDGECTSDELDGQTCVKRKFSGGNLSCSSNCLNFNVDECYGGSGSNGDYDPNLVTDCELASLFCAPSMFACKEAGGVFYPQSTHACANHLEYCCSVDVPEATCTSLQGSVCAYDQTCTSATVDSSDGACCLTFCEASTGGCFSNSDCSSGMICVGGVCESGTSYECNSDSDCLSGESCVAGACTGEASSGSNWWIWIVLLLILIILIVLGIVYKDKLRVWWMMRTGKVKTSRPGNGPPPGMLLGRRPTPTFGPRPGMVRPMLGPQPPQRRIQTQDKPTKDREMDETFKKLKEMSEE
jgi:hypothetical protein